MKCPICGGPSSSLGTLGDLEHWRCRNCGMDHSESYFDRNLDNVHAERHPGLGADLELQRIDSTFLEILEIREGHGNIEDLDGLEDRMRELCGDDWSWES